MCVCVKNLKTVVAHSSKVIDRTSECGAFEQVEIDQFLSESNVNN